jgi:hypothetical protein
LAGPRNCDSEGCSSPQLSPWEPGVKQSHSGTSVSGPGGPKTPRTPSGLRSGRTYRSPAPLRRQLRTAVTCGVVANLSPLVLLTDVKLRCDAQLRLAFETEPANSASRRTNAVKFVGLSQTSALTSGFAQRVGFSLRAEFDGWHTSDRPWPFCHGVAAHQSCPQVSAVSVTRIHFGESHPVACAASGGVVVAQRGSALPQATLHLCWRFDRSFGTRRRALLPGVLTRLRPPSGYTDVKQGREADRGGLVHYERILVLERRRPGGARPLP